LYCETCSTSFASNASDLIFALYSDVGEVGTRFE
jgi:hypothetical protein